MTFMVVMTDFLAGLIGIGQGVLVLNEKRSDSG